MPRVPCPACATDVVVDPLGRCPEGHDVATAVDRVTSAIGSATDHPHEPEPWIATVEADEVDGTAVDEPSRIEPRRPEPVRVPGHDPQPGNGEVAADDLLSELHSLTDPAPSQDSGPAPSPDPGDTTDGLSTVAPAAREPHEPADEPTPPTSAPNPTRSSGLGELEAALRDLTDLPATNGTAPATGNGSGAGRPTAPEDGPRSTDGADRHHAAPSNGVGSTASTNGTNGDRGSSPEFDLGDLDDLFTGVGTSPAATPPAEPPRATPPTDAPSSAATPPHATPPSSEPAPAAGRGPTTPPTPPPPAGPPSGAPDPSPTVSDQEPIADSPAQDAPAPAPPPDVDAPATDNRNLDLANFTAKGGKVDRKGKRRRFGR